MHSRLEYDSLEDVSLFSPRVDWREHRILLLGLFLCGYFTFHLLQGPRSIFTLYEVRQENQILNSELVSLKAETEDMNTKVTKLRPETLDPDFLEERARHMLGYMEEGEVMVVD